MMNAASRASSSLLLARATAASNSRMSQRLLSSSLSSLRFMQPAAAGSSTAATTATLNGPCWSSSAPMNSNRAFSSTKDNGDDASHSDFAAQRKKTVGTQEDEALRLIAEHVRDNAVMVYMKGSPSAPMCGFSAKVVAALKETDVDFASVNVLDYPSIREGIKKYSDWPTIPQLYVAGEFIGGCDIVMAMQESGELKELLKNVATTKAKE